MKVGDLVRISRYIATKREIAGDHRNIGIIIEFETRYNFEAKKLGRFVIVNWGAPDHCVYECAAGLEVIYESR